MRLLTDCMLGLALGGLAACHQPLSEEDRQPEARGFPRAERPVAPEQASNFSTEAQRDRRNEANTVMDLANIRPTMTVADIGAGEGYYTVRLARRVGKNGRVLAEDVDADSMRGLGDRVQRERLDNVSIKLGVDADPRLPVNSFDRVFLVHMYHEVREPYAFLWHLRPALRAGGRVVVVDRDRPVEQHGMLPRMLVCEFAALGFRLTEYVRNPAISGYYAEFEAVGPRPSPSLIRPCHLDERAASQFG